MSKVLVSLDNGLLAKVDKAARAAHLTRSAYLSRLAERELESASGPGRRTAVRHALAALDRLFAAAPALDSTEAIRAERDAR